MLRRRTRDPEPGWGVDGGALDGTLEDWRCILGSGCLILTVPASEPVSVQNWNGELGVEEIKVGWGWGEVLQTC